MKSSPVPQRSVLLGMWQMLENGLTSHLTEVVVVFRGHIMLVSITIGHTTAPDMLLSAGCDNVVLVWSVGDWRACALTSSVMSAGIATAASSTQFAKMKAYVLLPGGGAEGS